MIRKDEQKRELSNNGIIMKKIYNRPYYLNSMPIAYYITYNNGESWRTLDNRDGEVMWDASDNITECDDLEPHEKPGVYRVMVTWETHQELYVKAKNSSHAEMVARENCNIQTAINDHGFQDDPEIDWDGENPEALELYDEDVQ